MARKKFDQLRTMAMRPADSLDAAARARRSHLSGEGRRPWTSIGSPGARAAFSGDRGNGEGCVEVAPVPAGVAVRDTKDRSLAPHVYARSTWGALLTAVRAGEFA